MATNKPSDRSIKALKADTKEYEVTDGGVLALRVKKDVGLFVIPVLLQKTST